MRENIWQGAILEMWLPLVLKVANLNPARQQDSSLHQRLQDALQNVIDGGPGLVPGSMARELRGDRDTRWLPPVGVRVVKGRSVPVVQPPQVPALGLAVGNLVEPVRQTEERLHGVVMALAADPRRRLLRRCDECRAFFLVKVDHRRAHSFCSEEHRRAYDVAHRDPKEMAQYMRDYRKVKGRKGKKARRKQR